MSEHLQYLGSSTKSLSNSMFFKWEESIPNVIKHGNELPIKEPNDQQER